MFFMTLGPPTLFELFMGRFPITDTLEVLLSIGCFSLTLMIVLRRALSDGLLVIRHLFGPLAMLWLPGWWDGATRSEAKEISALLSAVETELDVDGNGKQALSDGLLLIRYLFGFSGDAHWGAIGEGATRATAEEIESYVEARTPGT